MTGGEMNKLTIATMQVEALRNQLADAQATVEALQAEKLMLESGVSAQSALIDGLQSQLIQCTADLEALQRERDEANSHVKFLGATKQANGSFCLDMKKYHAGHRCGRHRDDPWQGIDTEIDCFVCLKQALDAEREKVREYAQHLAVGNCRLEGAPYGRGEFLGPLSPDDRQQGKVEGIQESKNLVSEFIEAWLLAGMVAKLLTPAVHEAVGGLSRDLRRELQKIEQAAQDEKGVGE